MMYKVSQKKTLLCSKAYNSSLEASIGMRRGKKNKVLYSFCSGVSFSSLLYP